MTAQQDIDFWIKRASPLRKQHIQQLSGLRDQAGEEWGKVKLDSALLRRPKVLKTLLEAGISSFQIKLDPYVDNVRIQSITLNAPLETHQLLDEYGVENLSWEKTSMLLMQSLKASWPNSVRALHRMHPHEVEASMHEKHAIGALTALYTYLRKTTSQAHEIAQLATDWGAQWERFRAGVEKNGFPAEIDIFHVFVREEQARTMQKQANQIQPNPPRRTQARL